MQILLITLKSMILNILICKMEKLFSSFTLTFIFMKKKLIM